MINLVTTRMLSASARRWLLYAIDSGAWLLALAAATATRLAIARSDIDWQMLMALAATASLATIGLGHMRAFHPARTRRGTIDDAQTVLSVWMIVAPVVLITNYFVLGRPVPTTAAALGFPLALVVMLGARIAWRVIQERWKRGALPPGSRRVIVFGAGDGAEQIIRAMQADRGSLMVPVAVLDDDSTRRGVLGVPMLGTREDLVRVTGKVAADLLLIAIPSADSRLIADLNHLGREAGLEVRVLPSTTELIGMLQVGDIRELTESDLLGRSEVSVDLSTISRYVTGRRVLVTGAGGSIGSELCRQVFGLGPSELFMLDRDESALHALQLSIEGRALLDTPNLIVADIRDRERLDEIFAQHDIDVVFHTAALKHLTLLEQHPQEGVKTNVHGTRALLETAAAYGVKEFVNISTDKAADPTSVLGATKLLAERLTTRKAAETGLRYVSVRFGNVLGSRGSVLPTFKQQISDGGPLTVTHPDVTRFFMTIPEAVRLVLQAGAIGQPGEIMILDMGEPVKIVDVAKRLIEQSGKYIDIVYTGLREGEKMHEVLVGTAERGEIREHPRISHTEGSTEVMIAMEIELNEPGRSAVLQAAAGLSNGEVASQAA